MKDIITTKEEAKAHLLGRIAGLNDARLSVWGIGYDNDDTARMVRQMTGKRINELKEILEIEYIGDNWFSSAADYLKTLEKKD